jgi:putative transcriptional regulator
MNKKLFAQLTESPEQMGEISRGERAPSREIVVDAVLVQKIRASTGLSQAKFAKVINVEVATLRNWEQGRVLPDPAARSLLTIVAKNPKAALRALAA